MKGLDLRGGPRAQANMRTAFVRHLRHVCTQVDPEFRIALPEADRCRPGDQTREPKRGERHLIEACRAIEIGNTDGDMIDHSDYPQTYRHCEERMRRTTRLHRLKIFR